MTGAEILKAFTREIGRETPVRTTDVEYFINTAIDRFVKQRMFRDPVHGKGWEEDSKRRHDLLPLLTYTDLEYSYEYTRTTYTRYDYTYPDDFLFPSTEYVTLADTDKTNYWTTSVFECTLDTYAYRITNSLTDFHYNSKFARPLRIVTDGGFYLLTDGNYLPVGFTLGYIKTPDTFSLDAPFDAFEAFTDDTLYEIIKIAAGQYIENIGSKRVGTYREEIRTSE